jgi:HEAT repeat protein
MAELVSLTAEGIAEGPAEDELEALLGALQAEAIPTLVRALPAISDPVLRTQVEDALDRLVDRFPNQVTNLLKAEDPMLAAEAAGMVARLRLVGAAPSLMAAAARPEVATRRAAVAALGRMPVSEAVDAALRSALSDEESAVRVAAAESLAGLGDAEAASAISGEIARRGFANRDHVEQTAFLKAYVRVCGAAAVPTLARMLNGRRWWGGRQAASLRACAARALGSVATPEAADALRSAVDDRTSSVAHAVRISLRHIEHGPGPIPATPASRRDSSPPAPALEKRSVVEPAVQHVPEGGS